MRTQLLRPLLVVEFLIAVEVWLTFWSQVGGQYHLDLMFWPWKFGLTVAGAWLITAITAELFREPEALSRRAILFAALLFGVMVVAGCVTYYYHMNEPADDNGDDGAASQVTRLDSAPFTKPYRASFTKPDRHWQAPSVVRRYN